MADPLTQVRKARDAYLKARRALEDQINSLKAQRVETLQAWRPRAEVVASMNASVDRMASDYGRKLQAQIANAARPDTPPANAWNLFADPDPAALAFFCGDVIKARLTEAIEAAHWRGDGIDDATRIARIEDLDAALAQLRDDYETLSSDSLEV